MLPHLKVLTFFLQVSITHENILGIYDCEAANPLGLLIQQTDLRVISKPVIPRLLVNEYSDSAAVISVIIDPYPTYNFTVHIDCTKYTYCSYEEKWQRGFNLECKNNREFTHTISTISTM